MEVTGSLAPVRLEIRGMVIPNFKNSKHWLTKLPNGQPLKRPILITNPEVQEKMEKLVTVFKSQLTSAFQTFCAEMHMAPSRLLLIAWLKRVMPCDDNWKEMRKVIITSELCPPGSEGVSVIVRSLKSPKSLSEA